MKATWRGRVIAESAETLEVGGYAYFPREAVRMDLLQAAPLTEDDRACPHGVRFYDAAAGIVMAREIGAEVREMDGSQWRDDEWTRDVRCRTFGFFPPQSEWPFQSQ